MKWLSVEKPVDTRAAEVAAVHAMRMHSKIGAWQLSGTRLCLMLDLRVLNSASRDCTSVDGFCSAFSRSDVSFSIVGAKLARISKKPTVLVVGCGRVVSVVYVTRTLPETRGRQFTLTSRSATVRITKTSYPSAGISGAFG